MIQTVQQRSSALKEIGTAVRHSAVYSLGSILAKALGFAMLPLYTHYLGPGDYGLLEIMDLSISLLGMVLHMGIAPALLRCYAGAPSPEEKNKAVSTVFIFVGITGLVTFLFGAALVRSVSAMLFGAAVPAKYLLLSFTSFIISYIAGPFRIYLRAREESGKLVLLDTVSTIVVLVLNIVFIAILKIGLLGILLSAVIVNSAWLILACAILLRVGLRFSRPLLNQMIRFGLPLIFSNLAAFVLNFADRFFLQHFRSLEVVGLYAVGYKFGFMINVLLVQPFFVMWQSRMYAIHANEQFGPIFSQIFVLYSLVLTYAALTMALLSPEIVHIMAGPKFADAGLVIPVISLAYVICGVGSYLQTGMYLVNRTKLIGVISATAAVLSLALNYVLILHFGMMGAAWATVLSFGAVAIGSYWYSMAVCPLPLVLRPVVTGALIAAGFYLPFHWWTPATLGLAIAAKLIALAIFPIVLWKTKVLSAAEIEAVLATRAKALAMLSSAFGRFRKDRAYDC